MHEPHETAAETAPAAGPAPGAARADLTSGLCWMALAIAILIASVRMDRLEDQDINPYTIPGLLPGLLASAMLFFAAMLVLRALRRGALADRGRPSATGAVSAGRTLLVIALCVAFDVGLVGHGLPFWAAAAIFVTVAVLALERKAAGAGARLPTPAAALKAAIIGVAAGGIASAVFQDVFLVHLP